MRPKVAALCMGAVLLAVACGNADRTPSPQATTPGAVRTPEVSPAEPGRVNVPAEGAYVYDYESQATNAATPEATPRRSSLGAELTSEVSLADDVVTIAQQTTEGPAVATTQNRYDEDGVYELSYETRAGDAASGCEFSTPIRTVPVPLEETELDAQPFDGTGAGCDGERTVVVQGEEDVRDAEGVTWSTWRIEVTNIVRSTGLTSQSTLTRWFSADLGTDIRTSSVVESIDPEGRVTTRGETSTVLKSHPS